MSANLNIVRERVNVFNSALAQGAPVVRIPEHSYKKPKRNYKPYGGSRELWNSTEPRVVIHGPAECVAGETLLFNPITGQSPTVRELSERGERPTVLTVRGPELADVPFVKGHGALYKIQTEDGKECVVSGKHLFLTRSGWAFCENLHPGENLLVSDVFRPQTSLGSSPSEYLQDEQHYSGKDEDYQDGCLFRHRQYDEQLLPQSAGGPIFLPSLVDVRVRNHESQLDDAPAFLGKHNRPQSFDRLSNSDYFPFFGEKVFAQDYVASEIHGHEFYSSQLGGLSQLLKDHPSTIVGHYQYFDSTHHSVHQKEECRELSDNQLFDNSLCPKSQQSSQSREFADKLPEFFRFVLPLTETSFYKTPFCNYSAKWAKVTRVFLVRHDNFFDLTVPNAGHYFAQGLWHHNTGKSVGVLHLLDHLCWSYPNLQAALVRKVAADMPASVLQSFERKVLKMEEGRNKTEDGVGKYGGEHPEFYRYPNGSRVWVAGLDRPGKVLSSEKDCIVVNQAEELTQDDWETLSTRTTGRAGVLKPARLIGDANPGASTHWIPALAAQGSLRMIQSNHRDNPTLFDPQTGLITEQGIASMASLEALTGVRRKRLLEGKWVAAEGIVYEAFDKQIHMRAEPISEIRYHIAGVDWGLKNPGVIGVWGVDGDGRMYRVWEVYRTQKLVAASQPEDAWWINVAIELRNFFKIQMFVCDPSRPDHISAFQKSGLPACGAFNDKSLGIQNVESRLAIQPDGFPRLFLLYNSKAAPDPLLVKEHKPTCMEEEIEVYSWQKDAAGKPIKEEPVDDNNHALDAARYATCFVDKVGPDRRLLYA